MSGQQQRRLRQRFSTPPTELVVQEGQHKKHLLTPQRSAVLSVLYYCERKAIPCRLEEINEIFRIPTSTSTDILRTGRARRLENSDEVDLRGRPRQITNQQANQIADLLDTCPFDQKGDSWEELARAAGVVPDDERETYSRWAIQQRVTEISGIKTHMAAAKEDLEKRKRRIRVQWATYYLKIRPHSIDWRNVIWCDELHWMTGPRYRRQIKRRPGERYKKENIQRRRNNHREPDKEKHFHIYIVLGYNFVWCTPYDAGNSNGKMSSRLYIDSILPRLAQKILGKDLVLYQDLDSAHVSAETIEWMDTHGIEHIEAAPSSPDLSVMETLVKPIRERFYQFKCSTAREGVQRFYRVVGKLNQERINANIDSYPARLHAVLEAEGGMTKY